jgi:hypothetical protein
MRGAKTEAKLEANYLIPVRRAARIVGQSRQEVYRRTQPGHPKFLVSVEGEDGRRLIDMRLLVGDESERWRKWLLGRVSKPAPEDASPAQGCLFQPTQDDLKIGAFRGAGLLPKATEDVVIRRFNLIRPALNHDYAALGYHTKGAYYKAVAAASHTFVRNLQRWESRYKQRENLLDLADELPGPKPGFGSALDASMRAFLTECYTIKKLTVRQCYDALIRYLTTKQNSPGCRVDHLYNFPSYSTVARFIRSLDALHRAVREGEDVLKAACGHIDRRYDDLFSLDLANDHEWIFDVIAYDPHRVTRTGRYYVLSFLDARSDYPLVWSLVETANEQDEIDLLCRLIRDPEFGIPRAIYCDRGRFRGRTFGGRYISRDREEAYKERDGILGRLGISRNGPREHNPRGNRLERFHRELANWARTLPGWCGSDTKERRMTDADARVARHREWIKTGQGEPPLLSRDQLLERLNEFMLEFRQRPSNGTDMNGFSPEAVFRQNMPPGGFRVSSQ